jgi:hypothetical protein
MRPQPIDKVPLATLSLRAALIFQRLGEARNVVEAARRARRAIVDVAAGRECAPLPLVRILCTTATRRGASGPPAKSAPQARCGKRGRIRT